MTRIFSALVVSMMISGSALAAPEGGKGDTPRTKPVAEEPAPADEAPETTPEVPESDKDQPTVDEDEDAGDAPSNDGPSTGGPDKDWGGESRKDYIRGLLEDGLRGKKLANAIHAAMVEYKGIEATSESRRKAKKAAARATAEYQGRPPKDGQKRSRRG